MAANLIDIDNIVLSDDFETWFERTNEIIDALNPLQLYDFYDGGYATGDGVSPTIPGYTTLADLTLATSLGLKITRDIRYDGDMLIEIYPEAPLGFNSVTGALGFVWTGPSAPPAIAACGTLDNDDLFLFYDVTAALTKTIEAQYSLPPLVKCDHQFGEVATPVTITIKGNLIVDGTQTILSTVNVASEDKNIDLNDDGTGTGVAAGDDTVADGGGITLLSTDGNKTIAWSNAGDKWVINQGWEIDIAHSLHTRTIEPLTDNLDLLGYGIGDAVSLHFHDGNEVLGPDEHWRFTLRDTATLGPQVPYILGAYPGDPTSNPNPAPLLADGGTLVLQHALSADPSPAYDLEINFDSVTPTYDATIFGFARNLNADLLDGAHASTVAAPFTIPIGDAGGLLDPLWLPYVDNLVMQINQTAHTLVFGDAVRLDSTTPAALYILAQADSLDNAEAVGIVSKIVDANNFELTLRGFITGTPAEWAASKTTSPLVPGEAYFLSKTTAGGMTTTTPTPGDISKTMLVVTTATGSEETAIVMDYVGGLTDPTSGTPVIDLTGDVVALGALSGAVPVAIVERTFQTSTAGPNLALAVEDETATGYRTFDITLTGNASLDLVPPVTVTAGNTNSVTLIIHQDAIGGWTPTITVLGGSIVWDNSFVQPSAQLAANKATIYVLVNVNTTTVWYGSRAVFEL